MKKTKLWNILNRFGMPVTLMLLGAVLLVNPDSASILISRLLGWLLTAAGVGYGIFALLSHERRVSRILWGGAALILGSVLLASPLLLVRNLGRFLGILLAIEGGDCLRKERHLFGGILLLAAIALVFAPMTASRLVFSGCGLVVLGIGIAMLADRRKSKKYLDAGEDPNIIDAL